MPTNTEFPKATFRYDPYAVAIQCLKLTVFPALQEKLSARQDRRPFVA